MRGVCCSCWYEWLDEQVLLMTLTFSRGSWSRSGPGAAAEVTAVLAGTPGPYRDPPETEGKVGPVLKKFWLELS